MRRTLFIATIGLSAFLLFTLELLAGRLVLPAFGGAPSVWTTALCFFTAVVFIGYLYAHLVITRLSARTGAITHVAVTALALAATLAAPAHIAGLRMADMPEALNVIVVLALIAGAPAFLLSTTSPLLSAWYAQDGRDPWWLYAVSNGASLVGLLAYPVLIEPLVGLSSQRLTFSLLIAAAAACVIVVAAGRLQGGATPGPGAPAPGRLPRKRQAVWLLAAFAPAGLLSATTTHLATDHVSAPLLWVGPLAIYLGSFIVAFSERGRRVLPAVERLLPAAATLMWLPYIARIDWPAFVLIPLVLVSYAVVAVAIHGRLALDRPGEEHLTRFYLVLSAGGVLATGFVALAAPLVFSDVYEYPLLLLAGLVAIGFLPAPPHRERTGPGAVMRGTFGRVAPYLVIGGGLVALVSPRSTESALFLGVVVFIGALAVMTGRGPWSLAAASAVAIVALSLLFVPAPLLRVRTFFGVTQVNETPDGEALVEVHGTTLHGLQFADGRRSEPTAYFVPSGPLGDVFDDLRSREASGADIGIVGLGVGTVLAYSEPCDEVAYFEIDRAVIDIARDERYFTYLADAPAPPRIVLGDGRLTLAEEPPGSFDLLLLDAFSSDSVPVHLLTAEAIESYARTISPGGVIAFQLTNRHFDLAPAVASTAEAAGLEAVAKRYQPTPAERDALEAQASTWLVVGEPEAIEPFLAGGWEKPAPGPVLTDDYSNILKLLRLRTGVASDTP